MSAPTVDRTNYNALVDDSGSNLDGTNWTKNQVKIVLLDPIDTLAASLSTEIVVTTTSTGTVNDFAPGISGSCTILRCNNASLLTITGFASGVDGMRLVVISAGAGQVDLPHQNAGSAAANRLFNLATSGTTSLAAGKGRAEYIYDSTSLSWRLINHDQGAWIDYSSTSTVTGWSATPTTHVVYRLVGSTLYVGVTISGTSNATSASFTLPFTAAIGGLVGFGGNLQLVRDNGGANTSAGVWDIANASATVNLYMDGTQGNWTNTGTKAVRGTLVFQPT